MTLRDELHLKFQQGKDALTGNDLDTAINSFERAAEISSSLSPPSRNLIGLSYAYLALALGKKKQVKDALEKIVIAIEYFPEEYLKPHSYVSILLGIGVEFQKIELFECSSLVLRSALKLARSHTTDKNLEIISIIARNLAFSYNKIGNNKSAAKLFRIAADLEDNAQSAIDLYRNSSYIYYQEGFKEESLNILETAFEKARIIGKENEQTQIAQFQARIAYEIFNYYCENNLLEQALLYIDLCHQKFDFAQDKYWIIKTLYDKASILGKLNNIWQQNEILKKIIELESPYETNELLIKSILLLVIHSLETKNYSNADFYLHKIPSFQMEIIKEKNPRLADKVEILKTILTKSYSRSQVHTEINFKIKDLKLPVEELIHETMSISKEISTIYSNLNELKPSELNINISRPHSNSLIKSPSIEILQELFNEEERNLIDEPTRIEQKTSGESQSLETIQNNKIDLEKIFKAHQTYQINNTSLEFIENNTIKNAVNLKSESKIAEESYLLKTKPQITSTSSIQSQDENIRSEVCSRLQKAGWKVVLNFSGNIKRGNEPDILAEKGLIRKNRKLIFFAENSAEAELCSFLLQSNPEVGEKIVYLVHGNPKDANVALNIKIATQIDQIL